jgi:hypothetical protein
MATWKLARPCVAWLFTLAVASTACAQAKTFDHSALDALLKKHVKGDRVDYAALKAGRAPLDDYCERLAKLPKADLEAMARDEQFAFWIDAYNALTLRTIVASYPIDAGLKLNTFPKNSIRQIDGAWTRKHTVASREVSLDEIENAILRPTFKDPRVHAAINCASIGCPPLRAEAFVGARLSEQLDDNFKRFLADPKRNTFDGAKKAVRVSKIFDWFADDFGGKEGVLKFLRERAPEEAKKLLESIRAGDVGSLDYDWTLNDVG